MTGEAQFRQQVRGWCEQHIPRDWRQTQTGVGDEEFVRFQKSWFAELHSAGYAVPHWPREWGGGLTVSEQIVLYQELAAHDAPRLVLAFVGIHHAAATLLAAGTDEQRRRHLPAILDGEIWVQGFSEPEAGSDLASLRTSARRDGDSYVVNGQKLWASGGKHADWCLLLARTDPEAPKRKGISYFLLDMTTPGVEVRPIRNAIGDAHFCEIFLNDVDDREAAEGLVRAILWIDQDADEVEDNAWFDHQLVGLDVVRDDVVVGKVARVEHFPAQDLLIVRSGDQDIMVPFVQAIVPTVDVSAGRVIVTPPAGLFEELPDSSESSAAEESSDSDASE